MSTVSPLPVSPTPATPLMTAEEFAQRHSHDNAELVQGHLKVSPMASPKHGMICFNSELLIGKFVVDNNLGRIMTNDSFIQTRKNPDTVRGADVCFWSYDRLPKGSVPDGLLPTVPDLVIEVRSPSDRWTEVFAKVVEYLEAGVGIVILLDANSSTASVYRPEEIQQIFDNGDELTIPDLLPGFSVPVRRFFE